MFGYIYVNEQELKVREYAAYRSFYCGLCRNLHQRYGRMAQMMLNYDLTFLALLLTGVYEPETLQETHRCAVHPMKKHPMVMNDAVSYAADMCVLLSYQKLRDDWTDEHKQTRRAAAAMLKSAYAKVSVRYPRQTHAVRRSLQSGVARATCPDQRSHLLIVTQPEQDLDHIPLSWKGLLMDRYSQC